MTENSTYKYASITKGNSTLGFVISDIGALIILTPNTITLMIKSHKSEIYNNTCSDYSSLNILVFQLDKLLTVSIHISCDFVFLLLYLLFENLDPRGSNHFGTRTLLAISISFINLEKKI